MKERIHTFPFEEYDSIEQLSTQDKKLVEAAIEAMTSSYAPYSKFNVGASVVLENGEIFTGVNQENVAFPAGLCAERTVMYSAGAKYPDVPIVGMAIAGGPNGKIVDFPIAPCGSCRQVMAEFKKRHGKPMSLLMFGQKKIIKVNDSCQLLPFIFDFN